MTRLTMESPDKENSQSTKFPSVFIRHLIFLLLMLTLCGLFVLILNVLGEAYSRINFYGGALVGITGFIALVELFPFSEDK